MAGDFTTNDVMGQINTSNPLKINKPGSSVLKSAGDTFHKRTSSQGYGDNSPATTGNIVNKLTGRFDDPTYYG